MRALAQYVIARLAQRYPHDPVWSDMTWPPLCEVCWRTHR